MKRRNRLNYLLALVVSVALALLLGAAIMLATGHNPIEGYVLMFQGAFGTKRAIGNTLAKSATLCLTGLATAVAAQAGIFNVGGEGQLYLGAMASAIVGARLAGLSPWIGVPLCLLAAGRRVRRGRALPLFLGMQGLALAASFVNGKLGTDYLFLTAPPAGTPLEAAFALGRPAYLLALEVILAGMLAAAACLLHALRALLPE